MSMMSVFCNRITKFGPYLDGVNVWIEILEQYDNLDNVNVMRIKFENIIYELFDPKFKGGLIK